MTRKENPYKRLLIYFLPTGLVVVLAVTRLYTVPLEWMGALTGSVIYTAQDGTHTAVTGMRGFLARYFLLIGLHDENAFLKKEVERLHGEIGRLQEEEVKAKHLRRLLRFVKASPLKFIPAEVIGRETSLLSATLMINRGTSEGVWVGGGVITPRGVVGKVIKTFPHHAQVLLMTDARSAIAAMVQTTREEGMVHGAGGGEAKLRYLPSTAKVAKGDVLITSGLEGSFAKGLRLGRVTHVGEPENDFFLKIAVTPEVSFSKLEEVLVIAPHAPENPALPPAPDGAATDSPSP